MHLVIAWEREQAHVRLMNPPERQIGRALTLSALSQKTELRSDPAPVPVVAEELYATMKRDISVSIGYFSYPLSSIV